MIDHCAYCNGVHELYDDMGLRFGEADCPTVPRLEESYRVEDVTAAVVGLPDGEKG